MVALFAACVLMFASYDRELDGAAAARAAHSASTRQPNTSPTEADHPPVQPSEKAQAETWPDGEIVAALEDCVRLLTPTGDEVEVSKPIRNGQCGAPAPVLVKRIAGVEVSPAALVNCRLAAKLHEWIERVVQPNAQQMLGRPLQRIVTASSYMCRQRIGNTSDKPSEHSFANAVDISAFVTSEGRSIDVLSAWGPTVRYRQAQAKSEKPAGGDVRPLTDIGATNASSTVEALFLRRMHEGACGIFGTVLGPEANEAHRNHLHLDLAGRKRSAFCE